MPADWKAIKTEYITGQESYRALAERHGVSLSTLSKVAKKESWQKRRRQYGDKVAAKVQATMCARASAREIKKLEDLQQSADKLAQRINRVLDDEEQFNRHIVTRSVSSKGVGESYAEERLFEKVDTKAIRDMTAALKDMTQVIRNVYNLPTALEAAAMEIAAERLKMEQKKAQAGETDEGLTGVVELAAGLEAPGNEQTEAQKDE